MRVAQPVPEQWDLTRLESRKAIMIRKALTTSATVTLATAALTIATFFTPTLSPAAPSPLGAQDQSPAASQEAFRPAGENAAAKEPVTAPVSTKYGDALRKTPQLESQKARVANIAKETLEECIRNFAHYDDLSQAESSISGLLGSPTSGSFQVIVVTRLARVRRVLEAGRKAPATILTLLREELRRDAAEWPKAFDAEMKGLTEATKRGTPMTSQQADRFEAITVGAAASTYLVGELADRESLPLLVTLHKLNDAPKRYGPVTPALLIGAMREIITNVPESSLNGPSRDLRAAFLKEAGNSMSVPRVTTATSWEAQWDESDPRLTVLGTGSELLKYQPTMQMGLYPDAFKDGKLIGDEEGVASPRAAKLLHLAAQLAEAMNTRTNGVEPPPGITPSSAQ